MDYYKINLTQALLVAATAKARVMLYETYNGNSDLYGPFAYSDAPWLVNDHAIQKNFLLLVSLSPYRPNYNFWRNREGVWLITN